jgi:hypothetical protein
LLRSYKKELIYHEDGLTSPPMNPMQAQRRLLVLFTLASLLPLGLFQAASLALAGSPFGVYVTVNGGGQGCGSSYSYSTADGGSGGQSTSPSNSDFHDCSNAFSGTVPAGLTAASAQASQSMETGIGNGPMTASESTGADLASATLHAFATEAPDSNGNGGISTANAQAEF